MAMASAAFGIGAFLGTRLPERAIRFFAAAMFVGFGALLVAEGPRVAIGMAGSRGERRDTLGPTPRPYSTRQTCP
jgi:hypothetical protein